MVGVNRIRIGELRSKIRTVVRKIRIRIGGSKQDLD